MSDPTRFTRDGRRRALPLVHALEPRSLLADVSLLRDGSRRWLLA